MGLTSRNELSIKQITDYRSDQFLKAIELYTDLFPPEERKSTEQVIDLLNKGTYHLYILKHNTNHEVIGFALVMINKDPDFLFVDNIAIDRNHHGSGYGTTLMRLLIEMQNKSSMGVFIEVERPELALDNMDKVIREKRLDFYRKLEFKQLQGIDYRFPIQGDDPLPLILMCRPAIGHSKLSASTIEQIIKAVYFNIHSDVDNLDEIFQSFAHTIIDQVFLD